FDITDFPISEATSCIHKVSLGYYKWLADSLLLTVNIPIMSQPFKNSFCCSVLGQVQVVIRFEVLKFFGPVTYNDATDWFTKHIHVVARIPAGNDIRKWKRPFLG